MYFTLNNQKFSIRKCRKEDYRFVYELTKKNMYSLYVKHWGKWNSKVFRDNFDVKKIKIVEFDGRKIGFYSFEIRKNSSHINDLQIAYSMQGKGLGSFLIHLMEKETKKRKIGKIRLRVFVDNKAKKLYMKLGYKIVIDEDSSVVLEKNV
tara:strand:- start:388 stop:837 length:450 start_codon:yes stop_codon:yes gene_type:complete